MPEPIVSSELGRISNYMDGASHPWIATLITAVASIVAVLVLHQVGYLILRGMTRKAPVMTTVLKGVYWPVQLAWICITLEVIWNLAPKELAMLGAVERMTTLLMIAALTVVGLRAVRGIGAGVLENYAKGEVLGTFHARRVQTQTRVLTRIMSFMVLLIGLATALMTFPSVRQLGTSMLASAGVAGIVLGFAAKPVLTNLLAGLQIALTHPIRLDDVVIVEGEWGWIEEINSTYVVVRIWDQRRLVVPLNYFIEKPFQNWTISSSDLIGTVFWWVDYRMPLEPIREELKRLCETAPEWDGRLHLLQVTDSSDRAVQLRALVSAADAPAAWDLRCRIREGIIAFIQREYPDYLPQIRTNEAAAAVK